MENVKWIFTDCFDTLLMRTCPPDHVCRKWAKNVETALEYEIDHNLLYETRKSAERHMDICCPYGEYAWTELVTEICCRLELAETDKLVQVFYDAQFEAEKDSLYVNFELLDKLTHLEKPIAVVADTPMREDFIRALLFHFNISQNIDRIFTSGDYHSYKYDGRLYLQVLNMLGIEGEEAVMYGDNPENDVQEAGKCGIEGFLVTNQTDYTYSSMKSLESKIGKTLFKKKYHPDSFSNFALTLFLYAERLYRKCVKDKVECLYFFSGTGELLKTIFDAYLEEMHVSIPTYYLYASEESLLMVNMREIDKEDFTILKSRHKELSIRRFLQLLGFTKDEIRVLDEKNTINYDIKIAGFWESRELKMVLRDEFFRTRYTQVHENARQLFRTYLEQKQFYEYTKIGVADIGFDGAVQDQLFPMLENGQTMHGYYFGLNSAAATMPGNNKDGIMFSDITGRSRHNEIWSYHCNYFETLFAVSHGRTVSYSQRGNQVFPIIREIRSEKESYVLMKALQGQIMDRFHRIAALFREAGFLCEDCYGFVLRTHIRTLMGLGRVKAGFLQKLLENRAAYVQWQEPESLAEKWSKKHWFYLVPAAAFFEECQLRRKISPKE